MKNIKITMTFLLMHVQFVLHCLALAVVSAQNLFSCHFENDLCHMSPSPTDSFAWDLADVSNISANATSWPPTTTGYRYVYVNTSGHVTGEKATLEATQFVHMGRACVSFDLYLSGRRFGEVQLFRKEVGGRDHTIWGKYNNSTAAVANWTRVTVTFKSRGLTTKLAFVSFPSPQSTSLVAIDNVDVISGCCPVDPCLAAWNIWSAWSRCPQHCNISIQNRSRSCDNPENRTSCSGDANSFRACPINTNCPGQWLSWSAWSDCDIGCGVGNKRRARNCMRLFQQSACVGDGQDIRRCQPAIDCHSVWSSWNAWGDCDRGCGIGEKTRTRTCSSAPQRCVGSDVQSVVCDVRRDCPARWSAWSRWGDCDAGCGVGMKTRTRTCTTSQSTATCSGDDTETSVCDISVDCVATWKTWDYWSRCDGGCGQGFKHRQRDCRKPFPTAVCYGRSQQSVPCRLADCEVRWSTWSDWSPCDQGCGFGVKHRTRECISLVEGRRCMGDRKQPKACDENDVKLCRLCPYECNQCELNSTRCLPKNCMPGYLLNNVTGKCNRYERWKFIQVMAYILPLSVISVSFICFALIAIYVTHRNKALPETCHCGPSNAEDNAPIHEVLIQKVRKKSWTVEVPSVADADSFSIRLESPDTLRGSRDIHPGYHFPEVAVSLAASPELLPKYGTMRSQVEKPATQHLDVLHSKDVAFSSPSSVSTGNNHSLQKVVAAGNSGKKSQDLDNDTGSSSTDQSMRYSLAPT